MKTFKLVSLAVLHQDEQPSRFENIPLIDGLIINKEDGENRWIVEAYVDKVYKDSFEKHLQKEETLNLQVTITKETNDPASVVGKVRMIKLMENTASILFEGTLVSSRTNMAEIVLDELIEKGFHGERLLVEFRQKMQEKKNKVSQR
ncbi:YwpF-like family protein [Fredinandcohnia quinoae]|uniref:YwpF-like family protein n=1 Tax=Fredinandcohnia quinoae TaxID=2918902 RepID=A0AAW5DYM9_9BACI|nr:YwpF-like family protein [Fredinandcohnia sp. SECRCQ15]MCH1625183.1 YwpF-like family protein [Fredinandcohnia sp. SECRCQ15]